MKLISRIIIIFIANAIGLFLAAYFVKGFTVNLDPITYLKIAGVFTLLNIFVRPLLKLVMTPILILTLGLGIIAVNAIILYGLYKIFPADINLGIATSGLYPLIYATLIISVVHFVISFTAKRAYKQ